jgi:hypothetical protein
MNDNDFQNENWFSIFLKEHKFIAAFCSAFLLDIWFDMCAYAANHSYYTMGVLANLTYPLISMVPILLVVEEKQMKNKIKIALIEGVGYAVAISTFMFVRDHFIK